MTPARQPGTYFDGSECDDESEPRRQLLGRGGPRHRVQLRPCGGQLLQAQVEQRPHVRDPDDGVLLAQRDTDVAGLWAFRVLKWVLVNPNQKVPTTVAPRTNPERGNSERKSPK